MAFQNHLSELLEELPPRPSRLRPKTPLQIG
jgi:hypothetical protein